MVTAFKIFTYILNLLILMAAIDHSQCAPISSIFVQSKVLKHKLVKKEYNISNNQESSISIPTIAETLDDILDKESICRDFALSFNHWCHHISEEHQQESGDYKSINLWNDCSKVAVRNYFTCVFTSD